MSDNIYQIHYSEADQNTYLTLIQEKQSFEIWGIDFSDMLEEVGTLEKLIEANRLTCRIYTKGRLVSAGLGFLTIGAGITALAGIAAHNLLTYNPDYEICRDIANNRILVEFKK
ncbi:hypothetical protein L4G92_06400 [Neisseria sp. ZJ106]|uniref:Uncharacterized protein n=1 Tax=Neisseria lisongii TaxID=2912188 RepID=A0ABY7RLV7_9NEIS|nr:hypothetical protein [Neisseria lisongii]MCF7521677.1 hypothetical protein [Neisseria lisongii]WCL72236.1 hypothetical protein PJU73_03790 [Neisseria lisongii]